MLSNIARKHQAKQTALKEEQGIEFSNLVADRQSITASTQ